MAGPCPCMSLQKGTIILAAIEAIFGIITLILFVITLIAVAAVDPDSSEKNITSDEKTTLIVAVTVVIVTVICQVALAIYLWCSAKSKNYRGCKIWWGISVVLLVISIIGAIFGIVAGSAALNIVISALSLLYRLYVLLVVFYFMKELKSTGNPNV